MCSGVKFKYKIHILPVGYRTVHRRPTVIPRRQQTQRKATKLTAKQQWQQTMTLAAVTDERNITSSRKGAHKVVVSLRGVRDLRTPRCGDRCLRCHDCCWLSGVTHVPVCLPAYMENSEVNNQLTLSIQHGTQSNVDCTQVTTASSAG